MTELDLNDVEYLTIENREKLMDWYDSWYHCKLSWPMITEMWIIYDRFVVAFEEEEGI